MHLGRHLLLQLEAFVSLLLARLADGRGGSQASELQEAALEVRTASAGLPSRAAHAVLPCITGWSCMCEPMHNVEGWQGRMAAWLLYRMLPVGWGEHGYLLRRLLATCGGIVPADMLC